MKQSEIERIAADVIAEKLKAGLDAGGPELTQTLIDLGMLRREGNRLVRTTLGTFALKVCEQEQHHAKD